MWQIFESRFKGFSAGLICLCMLIGLSGCGGPQTRDRSTETTEYLTSHILFGNEETANKVLILLNKGGDWNELVRVYTYDYVNKDDGGNIGWRTLDEVVREYREAVLKLKKGQYTAYIVKSKFGYHIIKLVDVRGPNAAEATK